MYKMLAYTIYNINYMYRRGAYMILQCLEKKYAENLKVKSQTLFASLTAHWKHDANNLNITYRVNCALENFAV